MSLNESLTITDIDATIAQLTALKAVKQQALHAQHAAAVENLAIARDMLKEAEETVARIEKELNIKPAKLSLVSSKLSPLEEARLNPCFFDSGEINAAATAKRYGIPYNAARKLKHA